MIYIMDGKTFLKMYIKENPSKVLKTQFIIVSSNIKHTGKYKKQVLNCNGQLYPSQALIMDYEDYDHPEYVNGYYEQLEEYLPLLGSDEVDLNLSPMPTSYVLSTTVVAKILASALIFPVFFSSYM